MFRLALFLAILPSMVAHFNLWISKAEMNRTLGLKAEMNYIENAKVDGYSTNFLLRVNQNIDHVTFTWTATHRVLYSLRAESEDMSVLPVLRIPSYGQIPTHIEEFAIEYRCAGHRSGQFVISLYFNFTIPDGTVIPLRLRQEKICTSKDGRRGMTGTVETELGEPVNAERIFLIIIIVASIFLVLIAFLLVSYFRKSKKEVPTRTTNSKTSSCRIPNSIRSSFKTSKSGHSPAPFLTSTPVKEALLGSHAASSLLGTSSIPSSSTASARLPKIIRDKPSTVDIGKALVTLHADRELFQMLPFVDMEGTFGEIRFAIWRQTDNPTNGDVDDEEDAPCTDEAMMCKSLKMIASPAQLEKFLAEALALHKVPPHHNIAQVACAASYGSYEQPSTVKDLPLICYRHRGFGNLKKFLINCRDGERKKATHVLRTHELSSMALQLSKAMTHLHNFFILHKDIAARNCIVSDDGSGRLTVQLCDNALSKDIFPNEYHCLGDNENRPLKWMSPEAIEDNKYTSASDVWSFGVLCWELMSLAATPFPDIDADDILHALRQGHRLPQPNNCPDQMFNVMFWCWQNSVDDRPTALQVTKALQEFAVTLNHFI